MAHDELDINATACCQQAGNGGAFCRWNAEARHAGIELQSRRQLAVERVRSLAPALQLLQRIDDRHDAMLNAVRFIAGLEAVQHIDGRIGCEDWLQAQGFNELGDEEVTATMIVEPGGDPVGTEPVGVRLDDRGCARRRHLGGQLFIVASNGR
ncbi:hypothetical protein D9M72_558270 [compost metagenome]